MDGIQQKIELPVNPDNFVIGNKKQYYKNIASLLLILDEEKIKEILENTNNLSEIKNIIPLVSLIPESDIRTR